MIVTAGSTNVSVYYYIVQDASGTSPGEPVTGLLFSDIETGGSASYCRQGAARTDLTLITLASASAAHSDGGFILVDDTNMPGLYRCDYPDAAFATGVDQVFLSIVVASANNAVAAPIMVDITDVDLRDTVRAGLTALPNAAADAAGGLPISDAGGLDLDAILVDTGTTLPASLATIGSNVDAILVDTGTTLPADIAAISAGTDLSVVASGTAVSASGTGLVLATAETFADDELVGATVVITGGSTGVGQSRVIIDNVGSTDAITVDAWTTTPSGVITYAIFGTPPASATNVPPVNVTQVSGVAEDLPTATALADVPTVAEFNARTLAAASYFDPAADTVTLAGTQGAITWDAQTISVTGATDNITLAGSGTGDCLTFTRTGSGNLFDTNWSADLRAEVATELATYDGPTNAEFEARTPTAAQLAYIVANAATGLPVTFTTSGGSTTAAVLNLVDGSAGSATDDQYNGRLLVFTDGTLKGVVTDITDYVGGTTTATITAIPTAPTASHNARLI